MTHSELLNDFNANLDSKQNANQDIRDQARMLWACLAISSCLSSF